MSAAFVESDEENADGNTGASKKKLPLKDDVKRPYMVSIFVYAMKQSYVLALIAMMVGVWDIPLDNGISYCLFDWGLTPRQWAR